MLDLPALEILDDDAVAAAPRLLGAILRARGVAVRLTEVEAYRGVGEDPGSHAHRGPTPRTRPMFGPAGTVYVYLSYGMHYCVNLVCGPEGSAGAVLLRAGEVVEGLDTARGRRRAGRATAIPDRDLARGPARLASALGVTLTDGGGMLGAGPLHLSPPAHPVVAIDTGPRVGVSGPGGGPEYPWRFWLDGDPTVSVYRAAQVRAPRIR